MTLARLPRALQRSTLHRLRRSRCRVPRSPSLASRSTGARLRCWAQAQQTVYSQEFSLEVSVSLRSLLSLGSRSTIASLGLSTADAVAIDEAGSGIAVAVRLLQATSAAGDKAGNVAAVRRFLRDAKLQMRLSSASGCVASFGVCILGGGRVALVQVRKGAEISTIQALRTPPSRHGCTPTGAHGQQPTRYPTSSGAVLPRSIARHPCHLRCSVGSTRELSVHAAWRLEGEGSGAWVISIRWCTFTPSPRRFA